MEKHKSESLSKKTHKKKKINPKMELPSDETIKVEMVGVVEANYEWKIPNFKMEQRYYQTFDLTHGLGSV